jgi:hypothetical protein
MAKSKDHIEDVCAAVFGGYVVAMLWDKLRNGRHAKAEKESILGRIREIEARYGLEPRRYNHGV